MNSKILSHYKYGESSEEFFNKEQISYIKNNDLQDIVIAILDHRYIHLDDGESVIYFANEVKESGLAFLILELRIIKFIKQGEVVFSALRKAIERENFHIFKLEKIKEVTRKNHRFIREINDLELSVEDRDKIVNVYAVCIDSFRKPSHREIVSPHLCEPIDGYDKPRHEREAIVVRERPSKDIDAKSIAYEALVAAAAKVAREHNLNDFEKVALAKCAAELSLTFFVPAKEPLKALKKTMNIATRSPADAFFTHSGVCGNFSAIAYNIANAIGLKGRIFLAKKGLHTYLEFEHDEQWFHAHPFNSKSPCDITRFE